MFLLGVVISLVSCNTAKPIKTYPKKNVANKEEKLRDLKSNEGDKVVGRKVSRILSDAERYLGTPYKLGGMSSSGFDCSGFVAKVFEENDRKLSRRSEDQAKEGKLVRIEEAKEGDLLFFATAGGGRVSHIGIVHSVAKDGEIRFIHSSTTKGIIISSLNEKYWNKAFLFVRRVI